MVMGVFSPFNFLYGFCFYCMRAGGDTRNAMLLDSGYMWLVPVPASLLMALLLPGRIDIAAAVLVVQVLMNLKVIPALWVLKKANGCATSPQRARRRNRGVLRMGWGD